MICMVLSDFRKKYVSFDNSRFIYPIFFAIASLCLLLMSRNSFLYPMNDSQDVNCFVTAGNLILSGKVPYKDFFEQKGPIVYLVHAFVLWLHPRSYHGLYLLEILCAGFYYIYNYKLLHLFFRENTKKELFFINVISSSAVYFSVSLYNGGEVEEYLLPLFSYLLYHTVKLIMDNGQIDVRTCIFVGMHVGIVAWSKYFDLFLYGICFVFLLFQCIKNKYYEALKRMFLFCSAGFFIITIPVVIYLCWNGAFFDMVNIYLFANAGEYGDTGLSWFVSCISAIGILATNVIADVSLIDILFIFIGCFILFEINTIKSDYKSVIKFIANSSAIMFIGILLISMKPWNYYYIPIFCLFPFLCSIFYNFVKNRTICVVMFTLSMLLSFILSFLFICVLSHPFITMQSKQEIAKIIGSSDDNSVITINRMDDGYYMCTGYLPDEYYFTLTNNRTELISDTYDDLLSDHRVNYVVMYGYDPELKPCRDVYSSLVDGVLADTKLLSQSVMNCGYEEVFRSWVYDTNGINCVIAYKLSD